MGTNKWLTFTGLKSIEYNWINGKVRNRRLLLQIACPLSVYIIQFSDGEHCYLSLGKIFCIRRKKSGSEFIKHFYLFFFISSFWIAIIYSIHTFYYG